MSVGVAVSDSILKLNSVEGRVAVTYVNRRRSIHPRALAEPLERRTFLRGDANGDGTVNARPTSPTTAA